MALDLESVMVIGGAFGAALAAMGFGRKTGGTTTESQATVLAGAITDSKQVDKIIDALDGLKSLLRENAEQRHADSRAERDSMDSLTRAMRDHSDTTRAAAIDPRLLAAMAQLRGK